VRCRAGSEPPMGQDEPALLFELARPNLFA
jgi:hypothetical protein